MKFDALKFNDAPAVSAINVAKNYGAHIKICAKLCIELALETSLENWPRVRLLRDRSGMHEEMACELGTLLGYATDETDAYINAEIEATAPEGYDVEYW